MGGGLRFVITINHDCLCVTFSKPVGYNSLDRKHSRDQRFVLQSVTVNKCWVPELAILP